MIVNHLQSWVDFFLLIGYQLLLINRYNELNFQVNKLSYILCIDSCDQCQETSIKLLTF